MYLGLILFSVVLIGLIVWTGILTYFSFRAYQTYRQLTEDIDKKDVAEILKSLKTQTHQNQKSLESIELYLEKLKIELQPYIQKIGFVRYNPFGNTGGDQSFCLCLLDGRGNGILLTSLHARQQTRIYTKEIANHKAVDDSELSKEELKCIKIAQKWSN